MASHRSLLAWHVAILGPEATLFPTVLDVRTLRPGNLLASTIHAPDFKLCPEDPLVYKNKIIKLAVTGNNTEVGSLYNHDNCAGILTCSPQQTINKDRLVSSALIASVRQYNTERRSSPQMVTWKICFESLAPSCTKPAALAACRTTSLHA